MPHKIKLDTKRDVVSEVFTTEDVTEVNARLATGKWTLLYGGVAHRDQLGYNVKPMFVLGRTRSAK